jgi:hypothetical protein
VSTINDPRDLRDLLGAYALGAVDADEGAQVEALVARDGEAQAELGSYRRATALLHSEDGPSAAVWSRIERAMLDTEPATPSGVVSPRAHRWRRRTIRVGVAVAVAAAMVALALWGNGRLTSQAPPTQPASDVRRAAEKAAAESGSRRFELISRDQQTSLDVLVAASGRAFVLGGNLVGAHPDHTLALFATTSGQTLLVHVVDPALHVVEFQLPGGTLSLVLGETSGPGRQVVALAQTSLVGVCTGLCSGTRSGPIPTPAAPGSSPATTVPVPNLPAPASSPAGTGHTGSSPAGGGLLPTITLPPLPPLPKLPLLG